MQNIELRFGENMKTRKQEYSWMKALVDAVGIKSADLKDKFLF